MLKTLAYVKVEPWSRHGISPCDLFHCTGVSITLPLRHSFHNKECFHFLQPCSKTALQNLKVYKNNEARKTLNNYVLCKTQQKHYTGRASWSGDYHEDGKLFSRKLTLKNTIHDSSSCTPPHKNMHFSKPKSWLWAHFAQSSPVLIWSPVLVQNIITTLSLNPAYCSTWKSTPLENNSYFHVLLHWVGLKAIVWQKCGVTLNMSCPCAVVLQLLFSTFPSPNSWNIRRSEEKMGSTLKHQCWLEKPSSKRVS